MNYEGSEILCYFEVYKSACCYLPGAEEMKLLGEKIDVIILNSGRVVRRIYHIFLVPIY
jgi:hypothetical protein